MIQNTIEQRLAGKRVVIVVAGEVLGGAERGAIDLAVHLAHVHAADVRICALDDRAGLGREVAVAAGIPWNSVPTPWAGGRPSKVATLVRVAASLRRVRPDVLLPRTNLPNVVCGLTWRLSGARTCIWNQCDVLGTKRFSHDLFRRALHGTPRAVTTAFHARDWLAEEWGFPWARIDVIRSEVRVPPPRATRETWRGRLGLREDTIAICMLAHLHAGKDHPTLLRAWRLVVDRLAEEGRSACLLLAGRPAGTEDDIKALAFDLDLREHIRFLGEIEDIGGLLDASDLAVFSSRSECLGRGATEPMAAALPVVATDVPGIREAIGDPGRAFLAPAGDAGALADSILRLARDPQLRRELGAANAELIATRQSPEKTSLVHARVIAALLAGERAVEAVDPASGHLLPK
jgi:glycosyltransferase involved in cell wall biosynthesis